ncbi:MAG: ribosome-associated translation inhibitor RaiA [Candidatus Taylorbacteria bacterium]|nr:ribosome-associated translation inhibitor RaiA [Candidatus Taylorbacteria bacterium]
MNIAIKGTSLTLTESITTYVNTRFGAVSKFVDSDDVICHVEVGRTTRHHKNGDIFRAEVRVIIGGKEHYVTSEKEDLYVAIDEVKDSLMRDIALSKVKKTTFFRRSGAKLKNMVRGVFGNKIEDED